MTDSKNQSFELGLPEFRTRTEKNVTVAVLLQTVEETCSAQDLITKTTVILFGVLSLVVT